MGEGDNAPVVAEAHEVKTFRKLFLETRVVLLAQE
jgi:hypothetical protein